MADGNAWTPKIMRLSEYPNQSARSLHVPKTPTRNSGGRLLDPENESRSVNI